MKIYTKIINNRQEVKPANRIIIIKDGFQTINPTEEMILADGWVEYITSTNPSEEELVETCKIQKLQYLYSYDDGIAVIYYLGKIHILSEIPECTLLTGEVLI